MQVIQGGKSQQIAGAKVGEHIWIHLITGRAEKVLLSDITRYGVEGFQVDIQEQPLTFYPFTAILKIKKNNELTKGI
jgi:hypothetical protein